MLDVVVIEDPAAATVALEPLRSMDGSPFTSA
jgi:hypothetical protein